MKNKNLKPKAATVQQVAEMLGHSSSATTKKYFNQLASKKNNQKIIRQTN
jgi:hypothetical protein